jgi:hypothetical protein
VIIARSREMKIPCTTIERDENLELEEKPTISVAVLRMKRWNMRYNVIVASLHILFCFCLLKHPNFRQVSHHQIKEGPFTPWLFMILLILMAVITNLYTIPTTM